MKKEQGLGNAANKAVQDVRSAAGEGLLADGGIEHCYGQCVSPAGRSEGCEGEELKMKKLKLGIKSVPLQHKG